MPAPLQFLVFKNARSVVRNLAKSHLPKLVREQARRECNPVQIVPGSFLLRAG